MSCHMHRHSAALFSGVAIPTYTCLTPPFSPQILSVVQIPGSGDRESICLPSLCVEHNYSNVLSQLVMKL